MERTPPGGWEEALAWRWPSAAPLLAHGMALVAAALAAAARQYGGGIRSARGGRWRLTFPSLPAAVDCALALQLALLTQPWDPARRC